MTTSSITETPGVMKETMTRDGSIVGLYDNCSDLILTANERDIIAWEADESTSGVIVNQGKFRVPVGLVHKYVRTVKNKVVRWKFQRCGYLPETGKFILSKKVL